MGAGALAAFGPAPPRSDTMRRQLVPICLLLGAALLAPAVLSLAPTSTADALTARPAAHAAPVGDARSCKPQPPVATTLAQLGAEGDVVELAFSVTPHADAGALSWALALPRGAQLVQGTASGSLPAGSAGTGPLVARVKLPPGAAQVGLDVEGVLGPSAGPVGAAGPESIRLRRALTWAQPSLPLADARESRVPVRHREGR
jgi:hypothetical protein